MLIFFVSGLVEIFDTLIRVIFRKDYSYRKKENMQPIGRNYGHVKNLLAGFVFILLCAFIPIRQLFPVGFPAYERENLCREVIDIVDNSAYKEWTDNIADLCSSGDAVAVKGYAFYPRFFDINEGYYDRPYDDFFGKQDYARLVFRLVGQQNYAVLLKTSDPYIPISDGDLVYFLSMGVDNRLLIIDKKEPTVVFSEPFFAEEGSFNDSEGE